MKLREFPDGTLLLKAEPREDILSALLAVLTERGIFAGSFSGIGACGEAEIAHFDPKTQQYGRVSYREPLEIVALTGNVSRVDGQPFVHAHVVLSDRQMRAFGGHLFKALAEPTCEIYLRPQPGAVDRRLEPEHGLRLLQL